MPHAAYALKSYPEKLRRCLGLQAAFRALAECSTLAGGSTEVVFGSLHDIRYKKSFRIGTVRSLQTFPTADDADPEAYRKAHALAYQTFSAVPDINGVVFTGIGGTATALAAIDLGLAVYDASRVQGYEITIARAQALCDMLEAKTKQQRKALIGLEERRADVIVFGAIIMLEFMRAVGAGHIIVSDRDNQEGYLEWKLGITDMP